MHPLWGKALEAEWNQPYFQQLTNFLDAARSEFPEAIFPPENQVFRSLEYVAPADIHVVILGQDPYPTRGHAHGLSFSVDSGVKPLPRSLNNIFRELQEDLGIAPAVSGDLSRWAEQGVLLLNSVLTVREDLRNSHVRKGWEKFTDQVIATLAEQEHIVYLLWGLDAHKKAKQVDETRNLVIRSSHPSPLGYTKSGKYFESFRGSKPFSRSNVYLEANGKSPIAW
jgi:uracil-DNA glycosylase